MDTPALPIYDKNTLEFVTVAIEFSAFVETAKQHNLQLFIDKSIKLFPLLYLKGALLPDIEEVDDYLEKYVDENTYELVRSTIADLLGEKDVYLDTFHKDMKYSDTPIAAFISENIADVFQDITDFIFLFRQGNEASMMGALAQCKAHFGYWGQQLLNALKAMHAIQFDEDDPIEEQEIDEFY